MEDLEDVGIKMQVPTTIIGFTTSSCFFGDGNKDGVYSGLKSTSMRAMYQFYDQSKSSVNRNRSGLCKDDAQFALMHDNVTFRSILR